MKGETLVDKIEFFFSKGGKKQNRKTKILAMFCNKGEEESRKERLQVTWSYRHGEKCECGRDLAESRR